MPYASRRSAACALQMLYASPRSAACALQMPYASRQRVRVAGSGPTHGYAILTRALTGHQGGDS
eukprot:361612-Chlamydomonas_euryale.AAC.4